MKNYSLTKNGAKSFILNYIVINNNIFINRADGEVEIIPYSIFEEKNILNQMKNQVLSSKNFFSILNKKFEIFLKLLIIELLFLILFVLSTINLGFSSIQIIASTIIFPTIMGLTIYKLVDYQKIRSDIKKHFLFIKNENNLNLIIRNRPEVTKGLDDELKRKVLAKEGNNFLFTINTIDKIEYRELVQVYNHIEYSSNRDKVKSLKKKKIKSEKL